MALSTSTLLFALFSLVSSRSRPYLPSFRHLLTCEPLCVSCETSDTCSSCSDNAHLSTGKCICGAGYYRNEDYCAFCPTACATCSKSDTLECSECSDLAEMSKSGDCSCIGGTIWNTNTRKCECADGYYLSDTQTCHPCISHCRVCEGPGTAQCIVCEGGLFPSSMGCASQTSTLGPDDDVGVDLAAAIGGSIGGLVFLGALAGCYYYWWNRCKGTIIATGLISS